ARPLEMFEPLFKTLRQLQTGQSRHGFQRKISTATKLTSEPEKLLASALAIDEAGDSLVRFAIAEAISKLAKKDRKWAEVRTLMKPSPFDIQIIVRAVRDSETLIEKEAREKQAAIADTKQLLQTLDDFESRVGRLRARLVSRLKSLEP